MEVCTKGTRVSCSQTQPPNNTLTTLWSWKLFSSFPLQHSKNTPETPGRTRVQRDSLKSKATPSGSVNICSQEIQIRGQTDTSKLVQDKNQFKTAVTPCPVCNLLTHPPPRHQSHGICLAPACTFAEGWACSSRFSSPCWDWRWHFIFIQHPRISMKVSHWKKHALKPQPGGCCRSSSVCPRGRAWAV